MKDRTQRSLGKRIAFAFIRWFLRLLLVLFTVVVLVVGALYFVCDLIFNGPSESARDVLTMSMLESSGMKWCPALFIGEEKVQEIQTKVSTPLPDDVSDSSQITINTDHSITPGSEWENSPDGIIIKHFGGNTYSAHIMLIRDPSKVFVATSTDSFSHDKPGVSIYTQIQLENAIAGVNAGAFVDPSPTGKAGGVPIGLVVSKGKILWDDKRSYDGFVGFNTDNILVVANTMTAQQAKELNIRDGCCFGPVLIMNNNINQEAYNDASGYNPRTAIGQRADGTVILLCIDGRQAGSLGGTYADVIDIMVEYGAVNACNLDGGSSSIMLYHDRHGIYGAKNELVMINNYSLLQQYPRGMPTFFMVRSSEED